MPYVEKNDRMFYKDVVDKMMERIETGKCSKGELNYIVTKAAVAYIVRHGLGYNVVSDAIAALQDAADELKFRILRKYEDKKCKENGDVYQEIWRTK